MDFIFKKLEFYHILSKYDKYDKNIMLWIPVYIYNVIMYDISLVKYRLLSYGNLCYETIIHLIKIAWFSIFQMK